MKKNLLLVCLIITWICTVLVTIIYLLNKHSMISAITLFISIICAITVLITYILHKKTN